ncbi:MAG: hypothetical protein WC460_06110 [Patescibacteria group bacterium]
MRLKAAKIQKAFSKLDLFIKEGDHKMAWFIYNGKKVLYTKLSHGSGEVSATDKIRCQLKLNETQFQDLINCPLKKENYIEILKSRNLIT